MINFPNAKLNIGLRIAERRPDGYHNLETIFVPVGLNAGTPINPVSFNDTLEIIPADGLEDCFQFTGRSIDCPIEKNLVYKAVKAFRKAVDGRCVETVPVKVILEKHLPDGAGLGGGSSDAAFTLRLMNELHGLSLSEEELAEVALKLGADCPFFLINQPSYGEGVGEKLTPIYLNLEGLWCVIVKPDIYVSTKEAFAGVVPRNLREPGKTDDFPLYRLGELPVEKWKDVATNDFELSLFPRYPELERLKDRLYELGAVYSSMSGSGSSIFGLFKSELEASEAVRDFPTLYVRHLML